MGYIKVAYQDILRQIDNYSYLPNDWEKFVAKQEKKQNLIIKSNNNRCFCTNCKHEFTSTRKVNEEAQCPNCHNKYLVKRSNLRHFEFKDYLSILDKVNGFFVLRYFELKSTIDANHEHHSSIVEFAREIVTKNYYRNVFVNERVAKCQCHIYIYHHSSLTKWREYTRNYSLIDFSIVYPNNIKMLLKDTEYQYSCIWDIAKNCSYIDLPQLMKNTSELGRVELLTKMKLYNLALTANNFISYGTFQEIFGVSKDYYPFMKRYNITYTQLKLLRLLKEKNIKKIRYLEKFVNYSGSTDALEEITNYISLNRFIKYAKKHHGKVKTYLYKDYLRFAKFLGLDLKNNRYAFPSNLKIEHDKLEKQYKIQNTKLTRKAIINRGKELFKNTYRDNEFIIKPARTLKALQNESTQQNNCVRTYAERYASGTCDIYFMRDISKPSQSLVTVEVKDNKVVQSRIKNNCYPTDKQMKFLQSWEQNVLKGVA